MGPIDQKTSIDWLRFRTQSNPIEAFEAIQPLFPQYASHFNLKHQGRGLMGFQQSVLMCAGDFVIGRMDYGGESQRGWVRVDIPGKGCEHMLVDDLSSLESLPKTEVRRLDVALTTWDGEITHEQVVQAHASGRFNCGGPTPNLRQITSSDPRAGRTCEIGKRTDTNKFLRCYEKGFQMLGKLGRRAEGWTHLEGHLVEDIYRCEVEFKAAGSTLIPWDTIKRRDEYFAGAYPFCSDVLKGVAGDRLKRNPEIDIQAALETHLSNCQIQYGDAIFTALHCYGGDIGAVLEKIKGKKHCQALIEAGVLLVDHV